MNGNSENGDGDAEKEAKRQKTAALNKRYRTIEEELEDKIENEIIPESDYIVEKIDKLEILYSEVVDPPQAYKDSTCLKKLSVISRKKIDSVQANIKQFNPVIFTKKLREKLSLNQDPGTPITEKAWQQFGQLCAPLFLTAPTFTLLYGTFEPGELVPKPRAEKKPRLQNQKLAKETQPEKVTRVDRSDQVVTEEELEKVYKCLCNHYGLNNSEPIPFFEFVIDPRSFGNTVENIFHVSFLTKDDLARLVEDEDGIPMIEPFAEEDANTETTPKGPSHQFSVKMNMELWEQLINTYNLTNKNPMIPH